MQFRIYLGHKDGVPIPKKDIPKGQCHFRQLLAGTMENRGVARLIDRENDLIPALYDPVILCVTDSYMELGGATEDGLSQTWILRFFPIEATAEWARFRAQLRHGSPKTKKANPMIGLSL